MTKKNDILSPKTRWAYAYELAPPQSAERLRTIQALLEQETINARKAARTWAGSVVAEELVTHILIVTDSPEQGSAVNRRLEAKLKLLNADFSITAPLAVTEDPALTD